MEVKKKAFTLKAVFFIYLVILGVAFFITVGLYTIIIYVSTQSGVIHAANYSENLARQAKPILSTEEVITENMIPYGCNYVVLDKDYQVINTNLENPDLLTAVEYAKGTRSNNGSQKNYYYIERENGSCVLQYYIRIRFQSEFLNQYFPSPEVMMILIFALLFFVIVIIATTIYAKNLKRHLTPLIQATEKIKEQDLDFDITYSGIKEFNDVLLSISDMKTELKTSLEQQWNLEQAKKEQISALAHDLKTPLTVIKGNAELLSDTALSEDQQEYTSYISKNTGQIEQYIKTLIEISNSGNALILHLESINSNDFINTIQSQLNALANTKMLKIEYIIPNLPTVINIDQALFYRAIMNILSNAVDYTPDNGTIYFEVKSREDKIIFIITDNGNGFSIQDMKSATKQFYMGDSSRTSRIHYGIGLYIAESFVKLHGGILQVANSPVTGGAQLTIVLPVL